MTSLKDHTLSKKPRRYYSRSHDSLEKITTSFRTIHNNPIIITPFHLPLILSSSRFGNRLGLCLFRHRHSCPSRRLCFQTAKLRLPIGIGRVLLILMLPGVYREERVPKGRRRSVKSLHVKKRLQCSWKHESLQQRYNLLQKLGQNEESCGLTCAICCCCCC